MSDHHDSPWNYVEPDWMPFVRHPGPEILQGFYATLATALAPTYIPDPEYDDEPGTLEPVTTYQKRVAATFQAFAAYEVPPVVYRDTCPALWDDQTGYEPEYTLLTLYLQAGLATSYVADDIKAMTPWLSMADYFLLVFPDRGWLNEQLSWLINRVLYRLDSHSFTLPTGHPYAAVIYALRSDLNDAGFVDR